MIPGIYEYYCYIFEVNGLLNLPQQATMYVPPLGKTREHYQMLKTNTAAEQIAPRKQ